MGIGDRIKSRREELNMTQEDLAIKMGYKSRSSINKIELGINDVTQSKVVKFAQALDTTPQYLMGWEDNTEKPRKATDLFFGLGSMAEAIDNISKAEPPNTGEPTNREQRRKAEKMRQEENKTSYGNLQVMPNDNVYMIPVFESVSAGFGAYACSDITEYFPMYIENPADAADMLCIKVKGDSMYPKIEEGDIVAVRKQSSVDSGSLAVMLIDGEEGVVKKVNYGPDWIELISINPMYPPRRFEGAEVQRLQVVGLVKKVIKNV